MKKFSLHEQWPFQEWLRIASGWPDPCEWVVGRRHVQRTTCSDETLKVSNVIVVVRYIFCLTWLETQIPRVNHSSGNNHFIFPLAVRTVILAVEWTRSEMILIRVLSESYQKLQKFYIKCKFLHFVQSLFPYSEMRIKLKHTSTVRRWARYCDDRKGTGNFECRVPLPALFASTTGVVPKRFHIRPFH